MIRVVRNRGLHPRLLILFPAGEPKGWDVQQRPGLSGRAARVCRRIGATSAYPSPNGIPFNSLRYSLRRRRLMVSARRRQITPRRVGEKDAVVGALPNHERTAGSHSGYEVATVPYRRNIAPCVLCCMLRKREVGGAPVVYRFARNR